MDMLANLHTQQNRENIILFENLQQMGYGYFSSQKRHSQQLQRYQMQESGYCPQTVASVLVDSFL